MTTSALGSRPRRTGCRTSNSRPTSPPSTIATLTFETAGSRSEVTLMPTDDWCCQLRLKIALAVGDPLAGLVHRVRAAEDVAGIEMQREVLRVVRVCEELPKALDGLLVVLGLGAGQQVLL